MSRIEMISRYSADPTWRSNGNYQLVFDEKTAAVAYVEALARAGVAAVVRSGDSWRMSIVARSGWAEMGRPAYDRVKADAAYHAAIAAGALRPSSFLTGQPAPLLLVVG